MDITILAVSKRLNGVCVAGIGRNNAWIRPTKKEELFVKDIKIERGYVSALNTYEFHFSSRCPVQCQSENYLIDEHWPIIHKGSLEEKDRIKFFSSICENSLMNADKNIAEILKSRNRSLILLGPVKLLEAHLKKDKAPEISISLNGITIKGVEGKERVLCTDLKFYSFAKQKNTDSILNEVELKTLFGNRVYIVIGLTKLYKGINWPMIIGIHAIPDYRQMIDYENL